MLELKNIKKDYPAGGETVHALKGIDLKFRESEFVSILGPSGCGKTTMLNIIGGLDKYTEGDLVINGRSTKSFKDRDWDSYRNHSIGFVFQSYNLIPHQTVLQNVELALTLSGVSKSERRERAKQALKEVGLESQMKKRPSEMSGGQMQRVAIARALVNDPDIILADEPTGALDTETSVQVMEILKKISENRLIIMVTHNPELAEKYSTRIIRMLDGVITDDSAPLSEDEISALKSSDEEKAKKKPEKKPSMSFATSFGLSLKNLFTKKGRTLLTSFAGSIGIIGIALIYAVSQGATEYINEVQEETLSAYPLTIEATHTSMSALMDTFRSAAKSEETHEKDAVYPKSAMYDMVNALNSMEEEKNDLRSFKAFIEEKRDDPENPLYKAISAVKYTYDNDLLIYTENVDGNIIRSDTSELLKEILAENMGASLMAAAGSDSGAGGMSSMAVVGGRSSLWQEMLPGDNGRLVSPLLEKQYDVVYGAFPTQYNEIVLVIDENNELDDMSLYALGLNSKEEMSNIITAALTGEEIEKTSHRWTYEEICGMEFRAILNSDCYILDEKTGLYTDLRDTEAGLRYLYDNALILKVSGIIRPSEDASSAMLSGAIGYTSELTKYVIGKSENSHAVNAQIQSPETDIFTGLPFSEAKGALSDTEKESEFRKYIDALDERGKAEAYVKIMSIPTEEQVNAALAQTTGAMTRDDINEMMISAFTQQMSVSEADVRKYVTDMSDEEINEIFAKMMAEQLKEQMSAQIKQQISAMSAEEMSAALSFAVKDFSAEKCAALYDEIIEFSKSTYEENLLKLGKIDLDEPSSISLYASSFSDKDVIEESIKDYNSTVSELSEIKYTDYVGLMMSSVTTIINAISYLLISFVAISLIVSSIMIGVITLISVQERTKEIGILRAIGASKRNVSSMFNAETVIIGFTSGLLGVGVTYLLCIPINLIIHRLTGIGSLSAFLPITAAIILIIISMLLTLVSGIIPSRSAAKKDPVVALRTE